MTAEEAAEEILKGAFRRCEQCKGEGFIGQALRIHDEVEATICTACLGAGQVYRQEYVCAALFLKMEMPELSVESQLNQVWATHKVADAAMRQLMPKMRQNGIKVDQTIVDELKSWQDEPIPRVPLHFTPPHIACMSSSQPNLLTWDQKKQLKKP